MFGSAHRRKQGDLGEAAAIEWLTRAGAANVWIPLFHSPDFDLIAEQDDRLIRVQVKTSGGQVKRSVQSNSRRYQVQLCTRGGNQSWTGLSKLFSPTRCDYVFILVADGRRWFVPSPAIEATNAIIVGGPKYSEFEVDCEGAERLRR